MKVLAVAMLGVLAVLVVVAAWVAIPRSPSPSPAVAAADPTSSLATAPPSPSSAAPTPAETESSAPTSPALDLGGIWIMPAADTRLTSYATTLSARPTGSGDWGDHVHEGRLLRHVGGRRQDGHVQGDPAR